MENPRQQTFEQGRLEAVEIALCTLLRMQEDHIKAGFALAFPSNVSLWSDITNALPVSEEWRTGLEKTAADLLRLAEPSR